MNQVAPAPAPVTRYVARIKWGSTGTRDELYEEQGLEPSVYVFNTEAELAAFLLGVDEAAGWLEYEQVEP